MRSTHTGLTATPRRITEFFYRVSFFVGNLSVDCSPDKKMADIKMRKAAEIEPGISHFALFPPFALQYRLGGNELQSRG
jgi:hypothetical protein